MSVQGTSPTNQRFSAVDELDHCNDKCKKVANVFYHATQLGTAVGGLYLIATNWNAKGYDVSLIGLGSVLVAIPITVYLCVHLPKYLQNKDCLSIIN